MIHSITKIISIQDYSITCLFDNIEVLTIDFYELILSKTKSKPIFARLINKEIFETVKCNGITLFWPGLTTLENEDGTTEPGDYDLDPVVLYEYAIISKYSNLYKNNV